MKYLKTDMWVNYTATDLFVDKIYSQHLKTYKEVLDQNYKSWLSHIIYCIRRSLNG